MAAVKICDRCGSIFENRQKWIWVRPARRHILRFMRRAWGPIDLVEHTCIDREFDLCQKCTADLGLFLNGRPLMGE